MCRNCRRYIRSLKLGNPARLCLYARHVEGLSLEQVSFAWKVEDGRHAVVLDDACGVRLMEVSAW